MSPRHRRERMGEPRTSAVAAGTPVAELVADQTDENGHIRHEHRAQQDCLP